MLGAMKEERLRSLMEQIKSGELRRNKNYDAFRDPIVREARRRQKRLSALESLLSEKGSVTLDRNRHGSSPWLLGYTCPRRGFTWSANLDDFEVDMLRAHPRIRELLGETGSGTGKGYS
jgi:hypothetical protein